LGNQFGINDFRFKDFLDGYYKAGKYMPSEEKREFDLEAAGIFYNHGLGCERLLKEAYAGGVSGKSLDDYISQYFQIIYFYSDVSKINESDLRPNKRILEMAENLKGGVRGKGNRYNAEGDLIHDWKYELPDDIERILSEIRFMNIEKIKKYEPDFFTAGVVEKNVSSPCAERLHENKGVLNKINRIFSGR
ncbi:MAG: hypothetical protein PHV39_04290, partial [Methanomicrobium sp.]|nr:hypothetical protein [Methanomicrobium sp.]